MIALAKAFIVVVEVLTVGFDEIWSVIQSHKVRKLAALIDQLILQTLEKFLMLVLDRLESAQNLRVCHKLIRLFLSSVHFL
jgi:hypothetical protein